ncbi:hypothetical protein BD769DRAFT_1493681, partial [Suillus cothurnatus]
MMSLSTRLPAAAASGSLLPSLLIPASFSRLDCPISYLPANTPNHNGKVTRMTGLAHMIVVYHHANPLSLLVADIVGGGCDDGRRTDSSLTTHFLITG